MTPTRSQYPLQTVQALEPEYQLITVGFRTCSSTTKPCPRRFRGRSSCSNSWLPQPPSSISTRWIALIALARLLEVRQNIGAQRKLILLGPAPEPFAGLEAELTVGHELFEIRRRPWTALDVGEHGHVDRKREIG